MAVASSIASAAGKSTIDGVGFQQGITTEVPEILKKLTLFITKAFYGKEHYVVADYIQRNGCVKEEKLRELLKFDQKYMRQILVTLKVDKLIKERMVAEETENNRSKKVNYYFINYKALLNVARYKFDHMRSKLEGREKNDVQRSTYQCSNPNCKKQYEAMDIGKIFDPQTGELKCWQCMHIVSADESTGPSEATRSSMAKFNEQTSGMFSILQSLDGIRFSREILEPPLDDPTASKEEQSQGKKVLKVGERTFNATGKTRSELYSGGITVSIGDEVERLPEAKEAVPWLQNSQYQPSSSTNMLLNDPNVKMDFSAVPNSLEFDHLSVPTSPQLDMDGPSAKKPKHEDIAALLMEEEGVALGVKTDEADEPTNNTEADETHVDEDYVFVQGERVNIEDVTEEMVARMSAIEKAAYIKNTQNSYADFY